MEGASLWAHVCARLQDFHMARSLRMLHAKDGQLLVASRVRSSSWWCHQRLAVWGGGHAPCDRVYHQLPEIEGGGGRARRVAGGGGGQGAPGGRECARRVGGC